MLNSEVTAVRVAKLADLSDCANALRVLIEASQYGECSHEANWQGAIPWPCLQFLGLSGTQVHQLLLARYLEHRLETTRSGQECRTFSRQAVKSLGPRSCLKLTKDGVAFALDLLSDESQTSCDIERPSWKPDSGELWWQGRVIRRFRHDAANQRMVLDAFEAAAWPRRLPNPFQLRKMPNAKKRLHWTIADFNACLDDSVPLRFRGDGRNGICWEINT